MSRAKTKPASTKPSLLAAVKSLPGSNRPRCEFTAEQRAEIDEVLDAADRGEIVCGARKLARALKARYDLPWSVFTIADRLTTYRRDRT